MTEDERKRFIEVASQLFGDAIWYGYLLGVVTGIAMSLLFAILMRAILA